MRYYKIIQGGNVIGAGCHFLRWFPRTGRFSYCEMEEAQAVRDNVTERSFHADWLFDIPAAAGFTLPEATVVLIEAAEYDEIIEQLTDGEEIPVPVDPEPEPAPEPQPDPSGVLRAVKALKKGEYFYLNRKLCKAKTAIACGAALTLNTNYEITTIENELTILNA